METTIIGRLKTLREACIRHHVNAFVISSSDSHMSEYVAPHWETRKWLSGFTGSAGTLAITLNQAALWTDSRYFIQAAKQLDGTNIQLQKEQLTGTPSIPEYLAACLSPNDTVALDGSTFSISQIRQLKEQLSKYHLHLTTCNQLLDEIWTNRPCLPEYPIRLYPIEYSGKHTEEKIAEIRHIIGNQTLLITSLDEIAWILNLRGNDISCNPLFISYLVITPSEVHFFTDKRKITADVNEYLKQKKIIRHEYLEIYDFLSQLHNQEISLSPDRTCFSIYQAIPTDNRIHETESPVQLLKAIRNNTEIKGLHQAMIQDGIALVRFLIWLEQEVQTKQVTEISAAEQLQKLRSLCPLYQGDSFDTIAGYKEHAAIVHYCATSETSYTLQPKGLLLLDSGAQYLNGTTDITRTIALGELTEEERTDYTLVLKGHIRLAKACFPYGTRGAQLDILARLPLWKQGMNYLHGTGHGVGHYLNVHEGPQSIRMNENPVILLPGMLTSNEPGVYKSGKHGIRIENLILTVPCQEGMYGNYLQFETVTLCPICTKAIRTELLENQEIEWLNQYHSKVYTQLAPYLNDSEREWLRKSTEPIQLKTL